MKENRSQCVVGSETARMLDLGHPWVIADKYTKAWPKVDCGHLVDLIDDNDRFLGTALVDPGTRVIARRLSPEQIDLDQHWLNEQIGRARQLRSWIDFGDTDVKRLVNAEGDELPGLTIDQYGSFLQIQYFTRAWEPYLGMISAVLEEQLEPEGVYAKYRPQETRRLAAGKKASTPKGRLLQGTRAPADLLARENGLFYRIDLEQDLNTGLFHDQRCNRFELRRMAAGCDLLNLFAYTGAFSVAAAAGGANRVTSVDASSRYLDWARENFRHNDIDPAAHEFIVGDCFAELDHLAQNNRLFDIILMDPPSFSTTRKSRFTTSGGTADLVEKSLGLLAPDGLLITSSNLQKMSLGDYLKELRRGAVAAGRSLQVIRVSGQAEDFPFSVSFPEGQYLKYVVSRVV